MADRRTDIPGEDGGVDGDPADARHLSERAELLPEERAAGSEAPLDQAAAVLEESLARTEHPDPDVGSQSGRRTSANAADVG